jgi:hypothetical protein
MSIIRSKEKVSTKGYGRDDESTVLIYAFDSAMVHLIVTSGRMEFSLPASGEEMRAIGEALIRAADVCKEMQQVAA